MVTLKDISKHTGVSLTQVSRALGGHNDVSKETKRKVESAAENLGYRSNLLARGLKTGRSGLIALVIPSLLAPSDQEVMFQNFVGISAELAKQKLKLVLIACQVDEDPTLLHEDLYRGGDIDGFVVLLPTADDPRIRRLTELNIPHVTYGRDPKIEHPCVEVDNNAIGFELGKHLIELGHTRILIINGPKDSLYSQERAKGFVEASAGRENLRLEMSFGPATRERGLQETLDCWGKTERPTAIVAVNPMVARGVYDAATRLNLSIPNDFSVLCHNDGLPNYSPDSFEPMLSGTFADMQDGWAKVTLLLKKIIASEISIPDLVELKHKFQPGLSARQINGKSGHQIEP